MEGSGNETTTSHLMIRRHIRDTVPNKRCGQFSVQSWYIPTTTTPHFVYTYHFVFVFDFWSKGFNSNACMSNIIYMVNICIASSTSQSTRLGFCGMKIYGSSFHFTLLDDDSKVCWRCGVVRFMSAPCNHRRSSSIRFLNSNILNQKPNSNNSSNRIQITRIIDSVD